MSKKRPTRIFNALRRGPVRLVLAVLLLFFPTRVVRPVVNSFGHAIAPGARVGFSCLMVDRLVMARGAQVGHFNFVRIRRLVLRKNARLGHLNNCRGPLSMRLDERAMIGNRNTITRAPLGTTFGPAHLCLGMLAKITAEHSVDCTQSIHMGHYSTLAGKGSQIWTHGYVHEQEAPKRYRVDGSVLIGNNVYLGSSVIVTGGVKICDEASVGVGTCVTKDLKEPGFYVSAMLRMLPKPADPDTRANFEYVEEEKVIDRVFIKRNELS